MCQPLHFPPTYSGMHTLGKGYSVPWPPSPLTSHHTQLSRDLSLEDYSGLTSEYLQSYTWALLEKSHPSVQTGLSLQNHYHHLNRHPTLAGNTPFCNQGAPILQQDYLLPSPPSSNLSPNLDGQVITSHHTGVEKRNLEKREVFLPLLPFTVKFLATCLFIFISTPSHSLDLVLYF